jgi:hypothetical protein
MCSGITFPLRQIDSNLGLSASPHDYEPHISRAAARMEGDAAKFVPLRCAPEPT